MARWIRLEPDPAPLDSLAAELRIPGFLARLLVQRGLADPAAAARFLNPSLEDLHDPFQMLGMPAAVERLRRACQASEKILIYGDYDVDGTTAVVLLRKAIEMAGGRADFHLPHRLREGYGMRPEVLEQAARDGVRLVVSVDTGIREVETVERGNQLGIDTIITDHHLPDVAPPPALVVLNPNQPHCPYPEKNLCGVGVAFKLAQGLLGTLGWPAARLQKVLASLLRLTAIGTVADVVPLVGENRTIVKFGLDGLRQAVNPGLKALLATAGFREGQTPSAGDVAFRVAPRLNAAGRMDTASTVIELFSVSDSKHAGELAARLNELNTERQKAEAGILDQVLAGLPEGAGEAACLVAAGVGWHRGVLGIVASRLVERFHRPALVVSIDDGAGLAHGSGRSIRGFHLLEALESMRDLFVRHGGHRAAAGFSMPADGVDQLRERLNAYAAARLSAEDFVPQLVIDAELRLGEITDLNMAALQRLEPYGYGNPGPVFAATRLLVSSEPRVLKDKHLRLALRQDGLVMMAVGWQMAAWAEKLRPGSVVDAAFTVETDDFLGGWRLVLRDLAL